MKLPGVLTVICMYGFFHINAFAETSPEITPEDAAELNKIIEDDAIMNVTKEDYAEDAMVANVTDPNTVHNQTVPVELLQQKNDTRKLANCTPMPDLSPDERQAQTVEMVNATRLMKLLTFDPIVTSKEQQAPCVAVLFFARVCQFSCQAAPHFNALARAFPEVKMIAMDALKHHGINAQFGIVGVPTLKLFHNGKPIGKFNGTEYALEAFVSFVKTYTNLEGDSTIVLPKDYSGPVPSEIEKELDYFLVMSWLFILICGVYFFGKSSWWKSIVEMVQNNWREAEAQHEHAD